jgi:hypothetical protein
MPQETVGYVELEWTCVHCGTKNPGTRQTCSGCGAPMSDSQKFEAPAQSKLITDKDALAKAASGPDIHCPWCGTRNVAGAARCVHCGGDLTSGAARAQGEVLGAAQTGPAPDVKCPFCGTPNAAGAPKCKNCGGTLGPNPVPPAQPRPAGRSLGVVPIVIIAAVVVACAVLAILLTRTSDAAAVVSAVSWQRDIAVLELRPVQKQAWKDEVPSDAQLGACEQKVRRTQDSPTANSEKVCGTPYLVDQGNGTAKEVQDCKYNVLDNYCKYTVKEWSAVKQATAKGSDLNPQWPAFTLASGQREGDRTEAYNVFFDSSGKSYTYSPKDVAEYSTYTIGSKWTLKVNGLGGVTSVTPAK